MGRPPELFEYLDYRAYLADYYAHMKAAHRGFSYRSFSRRAKLGAPNHLKRVIDGERNLTAEMTARFAQALGLVGESAEYFTQLVRLGQADSTIERSKAYAKLTAFRTFRKTRKLDLAHAEYHATWYVPAIRELAGRADFRATPEWIARRLVPPIKPTEAKGALKTLLKLGLLKEDEHHNLRQVEPLITTGPEMHALHIANYHRMMMERASESIDLVPSASRDISALTLLTSKGGLDRIKRKIQRFRRELLEDALIDTDATQVVQLNFQLFPLSVSPTEEPK